MMKNLTNNKSSRNYFKEWFSIRKKDKEEKAMINQYKSSNLNTIDMTSKYLTLGIDDVKASVFQYTMDNTFNRLFGDFNTFQLFR